MNAQIQNLCQKQLQKHSANYLNTYFAYQQTAQQEKQCDTSSKKHTTKKFTGRKRATIVTTLNEDIKRTKQKHSTFPIIPLISLLSLQNIHTKTSTLKPPTEYFGRRSQSEWSIWLIPADQRQNIAFIYDEKEKKQRRR